MNFPDDSLAAVRRKVEDVSLELQRPADVRFGERFGCSAPEAIARRAFVILGSYERSEMRVLCKHANVVAIVDDTLAAEGRTIFGKKVISTDEWVNLVTNDRSIISCLLGSTPNGYRHFVRTAQQFDLVVLYPVQFLEMLRLCAARTEDEPGRFFTYGYEFLAETLASLQPLMNIAEIFDDEFSRYSWYSILLYRLTLNPFVLDRCAVGLRSNVFGLDSYSCNRQFFAFGEQETFIDGGAYIGDTAEQFIRAVKGNFRQIYAFEPNAFQHPKILQRIHGLRDELIFAPGAQITLSACGLWNEATTLEFNPGKFAGAAADPVSSAQVAHIVDSKLMRHIYTADEESKVAVRVPVSTIDAATDQDATFIKLEIEGSELRALQGGVATIQRNRPKMALSVYHKPEDLLTIPSFVRDQGLDYRLSFRQHNPCTPDAMVLYCY